MESKNSNAIKEIYKNYAIKKGFIFHSTESLIPSKKSNLLFNISGGVRYQDELLQLKEPSEEKVASIQDCLRTDNLDSIGYSGRHHLFFEMLGHFMFYCLKEKECKEEFISFVYNFLIKEIGIPKAKIYATYYPSDCITENIWKKLDNNNIIKSDKNTFVSPYADKSALRTEILFEKEDGNLVELWNLVFTQFDDKQIFNCPSLYIGADSGGSLERIVSAYEGKNSNYENSMYRPFINDLNIILGKNDNCNRIADFLNASCKLIEAGIIPGSKVQSYALRKLLRTLFIMCNKYNLDIKELILIYVKYNKNVSQEYLLKIILEEQTKFNLAISNGIRLAEKIVAKKGFENIDVEYLKSTCGLPMPYIQEFIKTRKLIK